WLADKRDRIEVHYLPKYAPERNPDEYLNCDVKVNINVDGLARERGELRGKGENECGRIAEGSRGIARETTPRHAATGETTGTNRQLLRAQVHLVCRHPSDTHDMIIFASGSLY